ncbi:MAG: EamA family transporter [Betaproteobacteria bacterium]
MKTASWPGVVLALSAAVLWGTTGTAQHFAPARVSPYWIGALLLAIAAACFALLVAATERGRAARPRAPGLWRRMLLAGACIAIYNLAFFAGVRLAGVAVGTTIAIGSGPLFAGAAQALITRRPPVPLWWLGTALAIGGGAAIAVGGGGVAPVDPAGMALCLAAGFSYAIYTLSAKSLSTHASPARASLWVFAIAALIAVPAAWLIVPSGGDALLAAGSSGWLVVGWLGVVATGVAYLLFSSALRFISAATGVALAMGEPLTAFTLAVLVLGEPLRASGLAGIALILAGLALVVASERRSAR